MYKIIILGIFSFLLFAGCSSLNTKNLLTQDVISKPKSFCQLDTISISDIPIYDENDCYKSQTIKGFYIEERYLKKTMFAGRPFIDKKGFTSTWYLIQLPNEDFFSQEYMRGDRYEDYKKLPDNQCVKRQGTALSKEKLVWKGSETDVLEVIVKKKITESKRKEMLIEKQENNQKQYNDCNTQYNNIMQKWTTETNASNFCNSIRTEWMERGCKNPFTRECANIANPFVECYNSGLIKVNPMYLYNVF